MKNKNKIALPLLYRSFILYVSFIWTCNSHVRYVDLKTLSLKAFSCAFSKETFTTFNNYLHIFHRSDRSDDTVSSSGNLSNNVRHKIVVMGAARVGKSSLIGQFLYNTFSPKYKRTVEEMHHGDFSVQGVHLTLDILDTSGSLEFPAMRALSMSSADAFILVYDVNDAATFEEVRAIRDQIHETKASTVVPIVVVGNKVDLADSTREVCII